MVRVTCYGGVGQIGGNQILVEDGETRFFFDFGMPFSERGRYYEEYLKPRIGAGILDPLVMGLLPPIKGIYRQDLQGYDLRLWDRIKSRPGFREIGSLAGVFLSHAHLDHTGYVAFLQEEVPIYSSAMTAIIAKAIQDTKQGDIEGETVYAVPRILKEKGLTSRSSGPALQRGFKVSDMGTITKGASAFWKAPVSRELKAVEIQDASKSGLLLCSHFPVDHSIYGSTVFAVETSAGWIANTGDMRLNWAADHRTRTLVDGLQKLNLRALICEFTRAKEAQSFTEEDVAQRALQEVRQSQGLVIADFGPRNVHRLKTFMDVARATRRRLVVTTKDAYLLNAIATMDESIPIPGRDLVVYKDLKSAPGAWEKRLREEHKDDLIEAADIRKDPEAYILCFSYWDMDEMVDIDPDGGLYIYSSSEPYNEEQQQDIRRLRNWLEKFNLRPVGLQKEDASGKFIVPPGEEGLHASGHASGDDIIRFVKEVRPKTVIPVHTQEPQLFAERLKDTDIKVIIPEYGVPIELG